MSEPVAAPVPRCLAELDALVARDLQLLNYPPTNWVTPRPPQDGQAVSDVLIIGAGMCGLAAAFALLRRGVGNLRIVDRAVPGREGPWVTFARMRTLRSPKHLLGPALGLPNLTFRAWYEAQWGVDAWQALGRIERTMWMDYLRWYRQVLALPVDNGVAVRTIEPPQPGVRDSFALDVDTADGAQRLLARKVVLATGRDSIAAPRVPAAFAPHLHTLTGRRIQHSAENIDFAALAGRAVAVIGIGASAMDNAAVALEAGASRVHLLARADAVPRINKAKGIVYSGFTEGFPHLDDTDKLRRLAYIVRCRVAPPRHSVQRVAAHPAFTLHMNAAVERVEESAQQLVLHSARERVCVDHVILATGFAVDLAATAELAGVHRHIARWSDRVRVADGADADSEFLNFPYLGEAFEFTERERGTATYLQDLHCFNYAAAPSHGNVSGDIPSVSEGAERLANGIVRQLFVQDAPHSWQALNDFDDAELLGDELDGVRWWPALPSGAARS